MHPSKRTAAGWHFLPYPTIIVTAIVIAAVVLVVGMLFMHAVQYVAPFVYVSPT